MQCTYVVSECVKVRGECVCECVGDCVVSVCLVSMSVSELRLKYSRLKIVSVYE